MTTIVIVLLIVLLLGGGFVGYRGGVEPVYLGGGLGTIILVLLVLWLMGVL